MNGKVALVRTPDRAEGIRRAVELLDPPSMGGGNILVKPNLNTADPFPGSTHNDTLRELILILRDLGAPAIAVGDRSFAETAEVVREKGIDRVCSETGATFVDFSALPPGGWVHVEPGDSHWRRGFRVARPVVEADAVVSTCCLKTHGYGGVFTMSLKNSIGTVHRDCMAELHSSFLSMEKMIAEVNSAYAPVLIVLDGMEAFVDKGPMSGPRKRGDVILAGTDRIAVDAVGLAMLRELGSNRAIMGKPVFRQGQIARAVEIGLDSVRGPQDIDIVTDDPASRALGEKLMVILSEI